MNDTNKSNSSDIVRTTLALIGGAVLSFLAFGVLWIGTPWPYQALMGVPFFLLAFALMWNASAEVRRQVLWLLFTGAAPLGALMTRFRDANDSHLKPILVVCAWACGILAAYFYWSRASPAKR